MGRYRSTFRCSNVVVEARLRVCSPCNLLESVTARTKRDH